MTGSQQCCCTSIYCVHNNEMCWFIGTCWQDGDGAWALWYLVYCCYRVQKAMIQMRNRVLLLMSHEMEMCFELHGDVLSLIATKR